VILAARRQERLEQLADELSKFAAVHLLQLCARSLPVKSALDPIGRLVICRHSLINNAGLSRGLDKSTKPDCRIRDDRHQYGAALLTRFVVPGMVSRGRGHVVNLGSTAGHQTYPRQCSLCNQSRCQSYFEGLKQDLWNTAC